MGLGGQRNDPEDLLDAHEVPRKGFFWGKKNSAILVNFYVDLGFLAVKVIQKCLSLIHSCKRTLLQLQETCKQSNAQCNSPQKGRKGQ